MALQFNAAGFASWLEGRPAIIQELAKKYPPDHAYRKADGSYVYVIGWNENGTVLITTVCPFTDYDVAKGTRQEAHPHCLDELTRESMADWTEPR